MFAGVVGCVEVHPRGTPGPAVSAGSPATVAQLPARPQRELAAHTGGDAQPWRGELNPQKS